MVALEPELDEEESADDLADETLSALDSELDPESLELDPESLELELDPESDPFDDPFDAAVADVFSPRIPEALDP